MSAIANIAKIPELRRRILFTLGMLAVYRVGIFVTTPGVNRNVLKQVMQSQSGGFLGMFNLFSGGALEQMSIFALNIMPYVSASIILSLMTVVVKPLEELRKEGEAGQRKINQYTRYGTVLLSIVQGMGIAFWLEGLNGDTSSGLGAAFGDVVAEPGWGFRFMTVLSLTTGTAFLMWLGEQITERGIGNGISLIIFAGIVANLPDALVLTFQQVRMGQIQPTGLLIIAFIAVLVTAVICFFERAQRRIPINYAKRMIGRKQFGGQQSHLPLRVNMAGVIPPIFTSSLLMFPMTLANLGIPGMSTINNWLSPVGPNQWIYLTVFAVMTIFFCFFYTSVTFQPVDVAENLKKQSAVIPQVRPGKATADYIDRVLTRITVAGAIYIAVVCTVPTLLQSAYSVPFYLGGTSLMIVVGVALDTAQQIESHLITRHYEGLTGSKGPRIRGRRA
ncbi:MAG: preprotein translocase subunit SecY [Deltaproteobacteria bacterium]|nr:preprotein translocase subunit SecY [Deltaproteobacteria bacterium]